MGRCVDEAKRRVWRQRLARFARSGQKVAAFCAAEGVSLPTFYQWKRELASESARRGSEAAGRQAGASVAGSADQAFLPVCIEGVTRVEIELPNGTRVRVPSSDLNAMGAAIAAAGRMPARVEGEASRC